MNLLDRLRERFAQRQVSAQVVTVSSDAARDRRGPVEHGPTKAPFSRERRRLQHRAAHASFMRNQRR